MKNLMLLYLSFHSLFFIHFTCKYWHLILFSLLCDLTCSCLVQPNQSVEVSFSHFSSLQLMNLKKLNYIWFYSSYSSYAHSHTHAHRIFIIIISTITTGKHWPSQCYHHFIFASLFTTHYSLSQCQLLPWPPTIRCRPLFLLSLLSLLRSFTKWI